MCGPCAGVEASSRRPEEDSLCNVSALICHPALRDPSSDPRARAESREAGRPAHISARAKCCIASTPRNTTQRAPPSLVPSQPCLHSLDSYRHSVSPFAHDYLQSPEPVPPSSFSHSCTRLETARNTRNTEIRRRTAHSTQTAPRTALKHSPDTGPAAPAVSPDQHPAVVRILNLARTGVRLCFCTSAQALLSPVLGDPLRPLARDAQACTCTGQSACRRRQNNGRLPEPSAPSREQST